MATVAELESAIEAQGVVVRELKSAKAASEDIKAAVASLLELKKQITALAPGHALAIVEKKKGKDKKEKKDAPPANAPSKKELRMRERAKKAEQEAAAGAAEAEAAADVFGDKGVIMSTELTSRQWTHVSKISEDARGDRVWVRGRPRGTARP